MVMAITIFIWILINSKEQHAINNVNGDRLLKKASKLVTDIKIYCIKEQQQIQEYWKIIINILCIYNKVLKGYSSIALQ